MRRMILAAVARFGGSGGWIARAKPRRRDDRSRRRPASLPPLTTNKLLRGRRRMPAAASGAAAIAAAAGVRSCRCTRPLLLRLRAALLRAALLQPPITAGRVIIAITDDRTHQRIHVVGRAGSRIRMDKHYLEEEELKCVSSSCRPWLRSAWASPLPRPPRRLRPVTASPRLRHPLRWSIRYATITRTSVAAR